MAAMALRESDIPGDENLRTARLQKGNSFPEIRTSNIQGEVLHLPDPRVPITHLQFRRFAGCPICNLHLKEFVVRNEELVGAGVREVVVFHSSNEELLPYQGKFPFDVIGDPGKALYKRYGVGTSLGAILNPGAWSAMVRGNLASSKPKMPLIPKGGSLGLPADFLLSADGTIKEAHYGKHADDHWSVDAVIAYAR